MTLPAKAQRRVDFNRTRSAMGLAKEPDPRDCRGAIKSLVVCARQIPTIPPIMDAREAHGELDCGLTLLRAVHISEQPDNYCLA